MNGLKKEEEIALLIVKIKKLILTAELTDWEKTFLQSVLEQVQHSRALSPKQQAVLAKLLKAQKQ